MRAPGVTDQNKATRGGFRSLFEMTPRAMRRTFHDVAATLSGSGRQRGDGYVIARAGGEGRAVYRQNQGLDANQDGIITAGEAAGRVRGVSG